MPLTLRQSLPARIALTVGVIGLVATGCGSGDDDTASTGPTDSPSETSTGPLTIDNCGFEITVDAPPERLVTIKSTATEMALALGLGDKLVGTAFADGPVLDEYAADLTGVPVLSDQVPDQEALLDVEPDFVYGGWESNFAADAAGERSALADFGITTYVAPAACKDRAHMPDPMTFDELFREIRELGTIFGVDDRAEELVSQEQALLDQVDDPGKGLTALWYSSGEDEPYVGADIGAPAMMMKELGVENIFADIDDTWSNVSREQIIDRNPDVIILVDAAWNTAADKIKFLEGNAATAAMTAVKEKRYLTVPFPAAEAGIRNAQAVVDLAAQLDALGIDSGQATGSAG